MKLILKQYILLTFLVGFLSAVKFRCDYSFIQIGWLKFHEIPASWRDARLRCRFEGGMLASPTSAYLKAAMVKAIGDVDIFTGIHDFISHGNFYTIDGIPLDRITHTWAINEPDNKNNAENCIAMNSQGKFSDVSCNEPRPYMCFRANSGVDANICGTPDSEYQFESRTSKCYKFHNTPRTFKRAYFVCAAEGGRLVVMQSNVEADAMRDLINRNPESKIIGTNFNKGIIFVGFHTYEESADWTTLRGQPLSESGYDKFAEGEPNNSTTGEYCGSLYRDGVYNDVHCEDHFPFICEKDANYPPVCDTSIFT